MIDHPHGQADLFASVVPSNAKHSATGTSGRSRPRTTLPYNGMAPAVAGSATSEAAAKKVEPKRPSKRALVYGYVLSRGTKGATRKEIAEALGMSENTVRPRVCELYAQWNTTYACPEVKESPDGRERGGCAVLLAAPHYREVEKGLSQPRHDEVSGMAVSYGVRCIECEHFETSCTCGGYE